MQMTDLIIKKRDGGELSREELAWFVRGVTDGSLPDYQISALLMAMFLQKLSLRETVELTQLMADSGDRADLSGIEGIKADKHSTGGVGDKTTLICTPLTAACGVRVAKMSGRGLGFTGGTADKILSIPGFRNEIEPQAFFDNVNRVGASLIAQTGNLAPADKRLYALRDVTGTVENRSLIAASIMSKKLASGCDVLVLDVKTGSGAFMKTREDAVELARLMVSIGEEAGVRTSALITDMDTPLGNTVGNAIEVEEAIETLHGRGPADLTELSLALAAEMVHLGTGDALAVCMERVKTALYDGSARKVLANLIQAQHGDPGVIDNPGLMKQPRLNASICAEKDGYLDKMDTEAVGRSALLLGAGRARKEDDIDPSAGIRFLKKPGDAVQAGEPVAHLYSDDAEKLADGTALLRSTMGYCSAKPDLVPLIQARVSREGVEEWH